MAVIVCPATTVNVAVAPVATLVTFDPCVVTGVKLKPLGFWNITLYVPATTLANKYFPVLSVLVVATTAPA